MGARPTAQAQEGRCGPCPAHFPLEPCLWGNVSLRTGKYCPLINIFRGSMDTDIRALLAIAQTYFDAAHAMDADQFAPLFHPSSSVTKVGEGGDVNVTPIETWLAVVRTLEAPQRLGLERHDEILSIDLSGELALL